MIVNPCPVCGAIGRRLDPSAALLDMRCSSCGWYFTSDERRALLKPAKSPTPDEAVPDALPGETTRPVVVDQLAERRFALSVDSRGVIGVPARDEYCDGELAEVASLADNDWSPGVIHVDGVGRR